MLAVAAVVLVGAAVANFAIIRAYSADAVAGSIELPGGIGDWIKQGEWTDLTHPVFVGASAQASAYYSNSSEIVAVYAADYAVQKQGREALFFANRPTGQDARIIEASKATIQGPLDDAYVFEETIVADGSDRRLVWFGVRVAGRNSASPMSAKINQMRGVLEGRVDAQVIVISTYCEAAACDTAAGRLARFASDAVEPMYAAAAAAHN